MLESIDLLAFILGASIGSFLNVIAVRFNTGLPLIGGRSVCLSCGKGLKPIELVPLVSYLGIGGRCRGCGSRISPQYFLVELFTGIAFAAIVAKTGIPEAGLRGFMEAGIQAIVWSLLIVIFLYDIRHKIIPDRFVFAFIILALIRIALIYDVRELVQMPELFTVALAGPLLFLPFFLLWLLSQGRWIGLGDGKLILGFGWMLGLSSALSAVLIGFWSGAIYALFLVGLSHFPNVKKHFSFVPKYVTGKTEIPFAPFLIFGYFLVYFFELSAITF